MKYQSFYRFLFLAVPFVPAQAQSGLDAENT